MSGCCGPAVAQIDGVPASGGGGDVFVLPDIVAEFDFSNMGTGDFVNGARTFTDTDGNVLAANVINIGAAATFRLQAGAGNGMQFAANATNSAYNSGAQTASAVEFSLSDIYTLYSVDASLIWIFEVYCSVLTFPTPNVSPGGFCIGLRGVAGTPSNSANRFRAFRRGNLGGTQATSSISDATAGSAYTTAPAATSNTYALVSTGGGVSAMAGTWGGTWQTTPLIMENNTLIATSTTNNGFKDRNNMLAIAFPTGNAAADMVVTVERLVLRAR